MADRFRIEFSRVSKLEFEALRVFDQRRVLDAMKGKLSIDPDVETRDKKCLGTEAANFPYVPPLWELKVGGIRVFYEVERDSAMVYVHAVRRKPPDKTTAEVLNEANGD
jgi:hypothetical protein